MTETAMILETESGPYKVQVASERSLRLVDIENPQGKVYWLALDDGGHAILCTCPGHANRRFCKHQLMVQRALLDPGVPLRLAKARLIYNPQNGQYETQATDTEAEVWARIDKAVGR